MKDKKPIYKIYKRWWFWVVLIIVLGGIGSSLDKGEPEEPAIVEENNVQDDNMEEDEGITTEEEVDRKVELEKAIRDRIEEGDYHSISIEEITINDDMGKDEEEFYIALIRLKFEAKNREKTANEMMRMYSDDLVATLANKGIDDISRAVVFWEDEYNNRQLKYGYDYSEKGFYITDVMGE